MRSPKLGKPFSSKDFILLVVGTSLFFVSGYIHHVIKKPELYLSKQDTALNINADLLIYLSAGNKRMLADLMWVQTLLESDLDHYVGQSKLNWMFLRFKTISILDPLFYENYFWGGRYLAIIKDDLDGGVELIEKGLKYYPDDYNLNYLLGFTYYYELSNYERGIYYLEKIIDHPKAPYYLKTIVYKMKVEKGFNMDAAIDLLRAQLDQTSEGDFRIKLTNDLYSLKAERDLKCLNSGKRNCDLLDSENKPYIRKVNKYYSAKFFTPYRLGKKGKQVKATSVNTME